MRQRFDDYMLFSNYLGEQEIADTEASNQPQPSSIYVSTRIRFTKGSDLGVGWRASSSLCSREKALVPGQLMKAGLLTEGPPLEEDSMVRGSPAPQRNRFLRLMFHSGICALPNAALCMHSISDQLNESMLCKMYVLHTHVGLTHTTGSVFPFFMGSWVHRCTFACSLFSILSSVGFYLHDWVLSPQRGY